MKSEKPFQSVLVRKILLRCIIAAIVSGVLLIVMAFLFVIIVESIDWKYEIIYSFLSFLANNFIPLLIISYLLILCIIIYHYWKRMAGYMEEIVEASKALISPDENPIRLSPLLQQVEDRMNSIKQKALRNERRAREEAQRKNDLIVYLAHDIKTPLTSVIGYLSLLDEAKDMPPEQKDKYVGVTLEKAYRLDKLIDEFFDITRFNLQYISVNKAKIKLSLMLNQMADEFYPMLSSQKKTAVVNVPDDLILWGDADKLSRVFNNILKNAIAYSYKNCAIEIEAFYQGNDVVINFSNQGDIIPKKKLDMIFEKFFRLDASRSSHTGGAGLGLAIAKEIVDAHGGNIAVKSNQEKTVFSVTLPNINKALIKDILDK